MGDREAVVIMTAIVTSGLVILIPIVALCARFVLRPLMQSFVEARRDPSAVQTATLLDRRIDLLDAEVQSIQSALGRLEEAEEFRRKLAEGQSDPGALRAKG